MRCLHGDPDASNVARMGTGAAKTLLRALNLKQQVEGGTVSQQVCVTYHHALVAPLFVSLHAGLDDVSRCGEGACEQPCTQPCHHQALHHPQPTIGASVSMPAD